MTTNKKEKRFHIHGDNIVECERTLSLVMSSLSGNAIRVDGPTGSAVCPSFRVLADDLETNLSFTFLPGFGRWNENILSHVRDRGGPLREAADAIITEVGQTSETPLIAIEYCGALPAGNQAWQRSGRAYSFARAKIPYVYIAELGGFELAVDRAKKAARLPNPAVPFSYVSFSASLDTPVLPVFVPSAGASIETVSFYGSVFGLRDLLTLLRALILNADSTESVASLEAKVLELVNLLASSRKRSDTLTPQQWTEAYQYVLGGGSLTDYVLMKAPLAWTKTAYIANLTPTARQLMTLAGRHGVGLTSATLPLCVLSAEKRPSFGKELQTLYPTLPQPFMEWVSRPVPLTICWVMGFKPHGDDARPDRGLPPLARMLVGDSSDLLTVVYGPAPSATWPLLTSDPGTLMVRNGLWEAVLTVSDAVLIDSSTAGALKPRAFLGGHWAAGIPTVKETTVIVNPTPIRIGEQDVDTVLHLLLARLAGSQVFEGMCNPPGGDWSGISLQTADRALELRWLSLPRVASENAKRPDHVFEIFGLRQLPVVLAVESKERAMDVENNIGGRLVQYVAERMASVASVQRPSPEEFWNDATTPLPSASVEFASAAAFVMTRQAELKEVANRAAADLVLGFEFSSGGVSCTIHIRSCTPIGELVLGVIRAIKSERTNIITREA